MAKTPNLAQKAIKTLTQPWTLSRKSGPPLASYDLLDPGSYTGKNSLQNGAWFWGPDGIERYFTFSGVASCVKAYEKCPAVAAVVNRKAQAYTNGKIWVLDEEGNEATTDVAKRLRKLMTRPNPLQTWKQFELQGYIYQQIFGFCPVLAIKPAGFKDNYYAKSLWNIPPFMIKIKESGALFYQTDLAGMIQSITLKYGDNETTLEINDILLLRDITPSFKTLIIPESRLKALEMPINNIIGAYESRNVLINYRGALGILSPEKDQFGVAPINPEDKEELQKDFLRYGLKSEQWKFIITSAALKWQQMGIPTKDLMLMEEVVESTKAICDQYGHPAQMLGIIDPKYDNWDAAEKGLYQNAIIPEAESNFEQWNDFFKTADHKLIISKDFDHVPVLQADQVKEATARKTLNEAKKIEFEAGLITLDQWLEALGEEPLPENKGQVRASDLKNSNVPLAVVLGVGGVQALVAVLTATISAESKRGVLEVIFGIQPADTARMVSEDKPPAAAGTPPGTPAAEEEITTQTEQA